MGKITKPLLVDTPYLYSQFDSYKNAELRISVGSITIGSSKQVWWLCDKGHSVKTSIQHRASHPCKFCSRGSELVSDCKTMMSIWDTPSNSDLGIEPSNISTKSRTEVFFIDSNGHSWLSTPKMQSKRSSNLCYSCSSNPKLCDVPHLSAMWDLENNRKLGINMDEYTTGSDSKVWFKREDCGHTSYQRVVHVASGVGCPKCSRTEPKWEISMANVLRDLDIDYAREYSNPVISMRKKFDFYLPSYDLYIELDGSYYHSKESRKVVDTKYTKKVTEVGSRIVRGRGFSPQYPTTYLDMQHENLLQVPLKDPAGVEDLAVFVESFLKWITSLDSCTKTGE